jgi:hypothetical protein
MMLAGSDPAQQLPENSPFESSRYYRAMAAEGAKSGSLPDSIWAEIVQFFGSYRELAVVRQVSAQLRRVCLGVRRHMVFGHQIPEKLSPRAWRVQWPLAEECAIEDRADVTDIRCLKGVKKLKMSYCSSVSDVSCLSGIKWLEMCGCAKVASLEGLEGIEVLDMDYCSRVRDLSPIKGIHKLSMVGCDNVETVTDLEGIQYLDMSGCDKVSDLRGLGGVVVLVMNSCHGVTDLSPLKSVEVVLMQDCSQDLDLSPLKAAHTVNMSGCGGLTDITALLGDDGPAIDVNGCDSIPDEQLEELGHSGQSCNLDGPDDPLVIF